MLLREAAGGVHHLEHERKRLIADACRNGAKHGECHGCLLLLVVRPERERTGFQVVMAVVDGPVAGHVPDLVSHLAVDGLDIAGHVQLAIDLHVLAAFHQRGSELDLR